MTRHELPLHARLWRRRPRPRWQVVLTDDRLPGEAVHTGYFWTQRGAENMYRLLALRSANEPQRRPELRRVHYV